MDPARPLIIALRKQSQSIYGHLTAPNVVKVVGDSSASGEPRRSRATRMSDCFTSGWWSSRDAGRPEGRMRNHPVWARAQRAASAIELHVASA